MSQVQDDERKAEAAQQAEAEARMEEITAGYMAEKHGEEVTGPEPEPEAPAAPPPEEPSAGAPEAAAAEPPATPPEPPVAPEPPVPPEPPVAPVPPTAPTAPDDDSDLDLQLANLETELAKYQLKQGANPKTERALDAVKNKAREAEKRRVEAEKRARKAEREKSVLDEPTQQKIARADDILRTFDLENVPEFQQKYVEGLKRIEDEALSELKATRLLPGSTEKFILENGGVLQFRTSQVRMPAGMKDGQGNPIAQHDNGTPYTHQEFYETYIEPHLTREQKETVTELAAEARRLVKTRTTEINEARKKGDGFFKERAENQKKTQETIMAEVRSGAEAAVARFGDVAKLKEVPATATAAEKAKIDEHNAIVRQAEGITQRVLSTPTHKEYGDMAVTYAHYLTAYPKIMAEKDSTIQTQAARIAQLEKWQNDVKNASKTGQRASAPPPGPANKAITANEEDDPAKRMEMHMAEMKR